MKKILFKKEAKEIKKIKNDIEVKLNGVENESQLSLDDIKSLRASVIDLLSAIDNEISNWE